ncbi:MAG: STAS domain-containing protein [Candidatus Eisenbacteria bacterium]|uniref:Anti-sigma factor antagonist n=1 Tax=Eiseniibacteriota bacterium TaxID=2212470 RepID=A0A948RUN4_UNCEI|nr:STAS domain-containing protein [Candidatus Eisenbacteria bacterium]MBU1949401.1 STAS domain-containing protein [Candidatus Eisenbacteria bacterium]MBU2691200.1 STAS domain-containing protein [Candidatus Eisenbacteria bacterium]
MKFSSRKVDDVLVFDLKGPLEGGEESYKIKDVIKGELDGGAKKILLNMDKVSFVNSTGIGIITAAFVSIQNAGAQMKIANANEKISRVMMVTKLLEVFDSYYEEDEALKAFRGGPS